MLLFFSILCAAIIHVDLLLQLFVLSCCFQLFVLSCCFTLSNWLPMLWLALVLWCSWHTGPEHTGHFVQPHVAALCGGDIYSRRKPLFSSFGEHTAVCGSSVRQAVARPRHRQSVCIHNIHVAATCRPSVLGSATMRGHMWLNKVASVLGPQI